MALRVLADTPSFTLTFLRVGHGPDPSQRNDEMTGQPMSDPVTIDWTGKRSTRRTIVVQSGDWPSGLYAAKLETADGRVGFAPFVLRPTEPGEGRVGGRPADEHVAGVQPLRLGRRRLGRHVVRGRDAAGRARPAVPRPGRSAAVLPLRLPVPPLAREDAARAPTSTPTTTSTPFPSGDELRTAYDLVVFPGPQRVHDAARLRRRRALPRPRRAPRVPLGEQLLLEGREARPVAPARRAVARAEAARGASPRCPVPGERRRDAPGAVLHPRRLRRALALRRHGPRERRHARRGGRRVRDRDRHDDAALAAGHARCSR